MPTPVVYVDADGCPVKNEVYRVAERYRVPVILVANASMRIPLQEGVRLEVVSGGFDAADDWIVENVTGNDIVITGDIPLASRSLAKGATVLDHRGGVFTENSIGEAMAGRELMSHLRELGTITGGPAPFDKRHRSMFLQRLDQAIGEIRRRS
jgi:uncharacterized protein